MAIWYILWPFLLVQYAILHQSDNVYVELLPVFIELIPLESNCDQNISFLISYLLQLTVEALLLMYNNSDVRAL
jgi:hypothetical protein